MIENGGPPFKGFVALATLCCPTERRKLPTVNVIVAARAGPGRRLERNVFEAGLECCGFMAGLARNGFMGSLQNKCGGIVIEADDFPPCPCDMAGFATCRTPVRTPGRHTLRQFPIVGIPMTIGTG